MEKSGNESKQTEFQASFDETIKPCVLASLRDFKN